MAAMQSTKTHIALLASPGMGHLIPVLELGKRFATQNDFQVTIFVVATDTSTVQSQLRNLPNLFNIVSLPPVDISALLDADASIVTKIIFMMRESLPALRSSISAMKPRPIALFADLFGTEAFQIADELEMLKYLYIASNAWFLAATIYFPTIDKGLQEEHYGRKQPLMIPGCRSVRFQDTLEAFADPKDQLFDEYSRVGLEMVTADGILVNTWEDLEPTTLASLRDGIGKLPPIYPIGPMVRPMGSSHMAENSSLLEWLDMQPAESVIYVCFGSGGTLSANQMIEVAWGLELSQQRFIWVVRPPMDNVSGSFFKVGDGSSDGTPDYLPDGFLSRNAKMGLLVPYWAPQTEILGHTSVGGFLSHCGWNSTLESIVNGVPLIAWPLYAEQKMNATMLTEELGVAVRSNEMPTENLVKREEIEMMVRRILVDKEGQAIRSGVKELKYSAKKASTKGGSSYNSLSQVAKQCEMRLQGLMAKVRGA